MSIKPPIPPFNSETAIKKVRLAENAWNTKDPLTVSLAYTEDSFWRNRSDFIKGREEIVEFLKRKWIKEIDYKLIKELWAYDQNRISVRFQYEWHDPEFNYFRAYGNENWEFSETGLMRRREASINDISIDKKIVFLHGEMVPVQKIFLDSQSAGFDIDSRSKIRAN